MVGRLTAAFGLSIRSLLIVSECANKEQHQTETGEDVQVLQLRDLSRVAMWGSQSAMSGRVRFWGRRVA